MSTEQLTLTAARGATIADMRDVEAHLNERLQLKNEYRALPATDSSLRFALAGDSASGFSLEITGTYEAIENAIGRWCTCCSTLEEEPPMEYHTANDESERLFGGGGRPETYYEQVRGSANRHIRDQTPIKLGSREIRFAITDHRMV